MPQNGFRDFNAQIKRKPMPGEKVIHSQSKDVYVVKEVGLKYAMVFPIGTVIAKNAKGRLFKFNELFNTGEMVTQTQ